MKVLVELLTEPHTLATNKLQLGNTTTVNLLLYRDVGRVFVCVCAQPSDSIPLRQKT
jgi:hypothetical protein